MQYAIEIFLLLIISFFTIVCSIKQIPGGSQNHKGSPVNEVNGKVMEEKAQAGTEA